jgi:hypothetical protein
MANPPTGQPANDDKLQTKGRRDNAAQPLNAAKDHGGVERYPDAETRTFAQESGASDIPTTPGKR